MTKAVIGGINYDDNEWYPLAVTKSGQAIVDLDAYNNIDNNSITSVTITARDMVVTEDLSFRAPSDVWASAQYFGVGGNSQLYSPGSYGISITSGGYRNSNGTWTNTIDGTGGLNGAAQVLVAPSGSVVISTDEDKADGSASSPTTRAVISDKGMEVQAALQAQELVCRKVGGGYAQIVILSDGTVTSTDVSPMDSITRINETLTDTQ